MDANGFCFQFTLNTLGVVLGVFEIITYNLKFFLGWQLFKDEFYILKIVTCFLCAVTIISALLLYGSFKRIRRLVQIWIVVDLILVALQLMILFDVININIRSSKESSKLVLYSCLEMVFLLLNVSFMIAMMVFQCTLKNEEKRQKIAANETLL